MSDFGRQPAASSLRVLPHSDDAERAVIGGLMLDNTSWDRIADRIAAEDFYRRDHRIIFQAIRELALASSPFDVVTVSEWLQRNNKLADVGGEVHLAVLARDTVTAVNIVAHADIVRERSVTRRLIEVGTQIADSGLDPQGRATQDLLDQAEQSIFSLVEQGARSREQFMPARDLLSQAMERIGELFEQDDPITGVPTGWDDFDRRTAGLQPGDLIVVAGRPSMGKTAFSMNLVENVLMKCDLPVAVFSMEMSGVQLIMRMLSSLGRIDQQRIRTGRLEDADWPRLTSTVAMLSDKSLYINDQPGMSPHEIRAQLRRLQRECKKPLGLVVIDYLQLMQVPGINENRATEVSFISRSLKGVAKEFNVPVVALSQLNRSLEQRADKRPVMSDLRESGGIEQDSDLICFIYRDEVYHPETEAKGMAEIIIGKQRNGPIGTVYLTFRGQFTRFENYTPDEEFTPGGGFGGGFSGE